MLDAKEIKAREALEEATNADPTDVPPSYTPRAPSVPPSLTTSGPSYPAQYPLTVWQRAAQEEALANAAQKLPAASGSGRRPYPTVGTAPSIAGPSSLSSSRSHTYYTAPSMAQHSYLQPGPSSQRQPSSSSGYRQPSSSDYALPLDRQPIAPRSAHRALSNGGSSSTSSAQRSREQEMQEAQAYEQHLLARCARGDHEEKTEFGEFGKIASKRIPIVGVLFLLFDREKVCSRCGVRLKKPKEKDRRKMTAPLEVSAEASAARSLRRVSSVPH